MQQAIFCVKQEAWGCSEGNPLQTWVWPELLFKRHQQSLDLRGSGLGKGSYFHGKQEATPQEKTVRVWLYKGRIRD